MGIHAGNRNRPAYSGQVRFQFPRDVVDLFRPREALEYKPPPRRRKLRAMTGVADLVGRFETREEFLSRAPSGPPFKTPARRRAEAAVGAAARVTRSVAKKASEWKESGAAKSGAGKTRDPFNTMFVWRLNRATTETALLADFGTYGPIVKLVVPKSQRGLPRGYAFVEFAHERDMQTAVRHANGRMIDGRRIAVDVERGRTVRAWLPNRLDGIHNSAASAARTVLGRKGSSVAEEARRRLAEAPNPIVIPIVNPPPQSPRNVRGSKFERPPIGRGR